ncbi:MAG: tryptophan 7-halogenase [Leptolyngbya sp. SIO1E4]|nr:tryptophan 7-halogenase [Leptolyngbya sp. SIO1E4]
MIKVAVIGGGTAGYIAAAHITKHFPQFDLYHIYDSSLPPIGVGEGTTLDFPEWLAEITALTETELQERCHITRKLGIKFENWGVKYPEFMQHFQPRGVYAYHISADKIVELLRDYVSATHIDKKVIGLRSDGVIVDISFSDNTYLQSDIVIDATGFPKSLNEEHIKLDLIPTNAALIRQGPAASEGCVEVELEGQIWKYNSATRTIARSHGWIFVIPLTSRTSYGYVYNHHINSIDEIRADFDDFLAEEAIEVNKQENHLKFPNFAQRTYFDGALFKIGNAASFLEPLEASAIGLTLNQIRSFSHWPLKTLEQNGKRIKLEDSHIELFNQYLQSSFNSNLLFVAWHYSMGSCFETKFWRFATANFKQQLGNLASQKFLVEFKEYIETLASQPNPFTALAKTSARVEEFPSISVLEIESSSSESDSGNIDGLQSSLFSELMYGIGYFS